MSRYRVIKTEKLVLNCTDPLKGMYKLSPFVWKDGGSYQVLIRAVNPSEDPTQKVARIYHGTSADGITFNMSDGPIIAPSTNSVDKDGCEDPTFIKTDDAYLVYYTGWNQTKMQGQLLLYKGSGLNKLAYAGIAVPDQAIYHNPKEATVTQLKNGQWVLFFEYADDERSKLAIATGERPEGPWAIKSEYIKADKDSWDAYHLSPGPVITDPKGDVVMFYNGSTEGAHWRIGWLIINTDGSVKERSKKELISPPGVKPGESDIAFASSALLVDGEIWLYYTTADNTAYRAIIAIEKG